MHRAHTLAFLFGAACIPTVSLRNPEVVRQSCAGEFEAAVDVDHQGRRKVQVVYEFVPGEENLRDLVRTPERETVTTPTTRFTIRGRAIDACKPAGVPLMASFPGSAASAYLSVEPVVAIDPQAPRAAASSSVATFSLRCCGEAVAGDYELGLAGPNAASFAVTPAGISCSGDETHSVSVRAREGGASTAGSLTLTVHDSLRDVGCEQSVRSDSHGG